MGKSFIKFYESNKQFYLEMCSKVQFTVTKPRVSIFSTMYNIFIFNLITIMFSKNPDVCLLTFFKIFLVKKKIDKAVSKGDQLNRIKTFFI